MILHNVMWESRPLPRLFRDPLQLSARVFVLAPPGIFCFGDGRQTLEDLKREQLAGRETFWEKGSPPRAPPFQKLLPLGLCEDGRACEEEQAASSSEALYPGSMEICAF